MSSDVELYKESDLKMKVNNPNGYSLPMAVSCDTVGGTLILADKVYRRTEDKKLT